MQFNLKSIRLKNDSIISWQQHITHYQSKTNENIMQNQLIDQSIKTIQFKNLTGDNTARLPSLPAWYPNCSLVSGLVLTSEYLPFFTKLCGLSMFVRLLK